MGSNLNFNNHVSDPLEDNAGRSHGSGYFPSTPLSSIYSLTVDEFQSTLGGLGKDLGSMNMDELLKSIWSVEETQSMATALAANAFVAVGGGSNLQRQGSLTLPRTISLMKVDDVWKDIAKEFNGVNDGGGGSNVPQRQQTLGEMTLEEFLARAGVVRDESFGKPNVGGIGVFGDLAPSRNIGDSGFGINFQQQSRGVDLMGNRLLESNQQLNMMSTNLPLNVNGVRTSQQHATQTQQPQQQQRQPPLFPKPVVPYGIVGLSESGMNNDVMTNSAINGGGQVGMTGIGGGGNGVPSRLHATLSPNGVAKNTGDNSVSPVPHVFNGGFRGRKSSGLERVVERRQKRMIKNRESAARSRARKQAYTTELEQEVTKLKEENEELTKKQEEIMKMQKKQALEMNAQSGPRKRLRRTQTGMW